MFDIVDVANSVDNLSHSYKRQLELNTLTSQSSTHLFSNIQINGVTLRCKQDTGAEVCVMPLNIFDCLNSKLDGGLKLCPVTDIQVIGYSKQTVEIVGKITVSCTHLDTTKRCVFYVTNLTDNKVLSGLAFCKAFNLVKILCDEDCSCKKVTSSVDILNEFPVGLDIPNQKEKQIQVRPPPIDIHTKLRPDCKAHVMELFPELFEGIGTIKGAIVKLNVDDTITPVSQPPRKIPQAMVDPLKQEIERMMMLGVIRKLDINQATDWCHNLVLVRKPNGKLRVCLDPRTINRALRFNVHNSRTFQDVTTSIHKVTKVSKIDANSGFWTLPMDEHSQLLTTFNTPWGRYCFVKMPFGLNQVQYFFQFYMDAHFQDINSTTNIIADDIMIHGEDDVQHDMHLLQVLNKCREIGLKLNPEKCQFGKKEVKFYGNIIGSDGVKPDPAKVDVILNMPSPKSKLELSSFLGMCNYLSTYIPHLSDVTTTLRSLNKKRVDFAWSPTYEKAFRQAKLHVANAVTLRYFDPMEPIILECDASGNGVGGTLLQHGQPVIFVSQALTDTQKRYSNIERELLAIVVVVEKLHHYIFGRQFAVHTDHSPLVNLFEKCLNDTSPRLQRLMLRLSQYQMAVKYITQKCVPIVDCMSRLTVSKTGIEDPTLNLQIADVTRSNVNWDQIKLSCLDDPIMIQLARIIQRGWPDTAKDIPVDVKPYFQYRYILHIVNGVIFLQDRIVVPKVSELSFYRKFMKLISEL